MVCRPHADRILLLDRLTALDAVGPYEVLSRLPGAELDFVAAKPGTVRTDTDSGSARGGSLDRRGPRARRGLGARRRGETVPCCATSRCWRLRSAHEGTRFTSLGMHRALVLGAAGILDGLRATTHWAAWTPSAVRRHSRRRAWSRTAR